MSLQYRYVVDDHDDDSCDHDATGATSSLRGIPTTVSGRCTVLEIGDSLGNDLGWASRERSATTGYSHWCRRTNRRVVSRRHGLQLAAKEKVLLAQYHPQLVIATFGGTMSRTFA